MPAAPARPRRSVLYMPGANVKALDKARSLPADTLIFDLEDAVAPDAKAQARANVVAALAEGGYGGREIVVRINALSTPWGADDLAAAVAARPHAILTPKPDGATDIAAADAALARSAAGADIALWAMVETPKAILKIAEIAAAAETTRLAAFVMGVNDLAKEMQARQMPGRAAFLPALALTVTAARAYGLAVIDGVFNDIEDAQGFEAVCRQGVELGFDGKTLIHPSQVDVANAIFAPPAQDVRYARAVIAAFADPQNVGKGVLKVDGKMTELLHLEIAKRVVTIADMIAAAP
jgi:citrate lyase subunit beta/citryl-CoA lyase